MRINYAYKFRIYPNQEQQAQLAKTFGCCRFLWNQILNERKGVYQKLKHDKEKLYTHKYKTEKEYKALFPFLKEVDSKALQSVTRNLNTAFQKFFDGLKNTRKIGYPNFKSQKNKQSYTTYNINNNIKIDFETKRIKLPKINTWIKYRNERIFTEPIKQVTVSKTKSGKYFISLLVECDINISQKKVIKLSKIEAFDMSAPHFLISERIKLNNPRFYRNEENRLKRLHRRLSRKKKGSSNRKKSQLRLARKYDTITNRKNDWLHKLTTCFAQEYDAIILERLNIKGMQQFNKGISKSVTLDFSWAQFVSTLRHKIERNGRHLVLVERFFPSSKLCSHCGWKNLELQLSEREWICAKCSTVHERDVNASKNLLKEGLKILQTNNIIIIPTVGTTGSYACGDGVRLSIRKQSSKKQESTAFR